MINAYNPSSTTPRSYTPSRLQKINTTLENNRVSDDGIVFLNDFNLYHSIWGGSQNRADDLTENFIFITIVYGLDLVLPQDKIT